MAIIGPTIDLDDRDRVLGRRYRRPQEVECGRSRDGQER